MKKQMLILSLLFSVVVTHAQSQSVTNTGDVSVTSETNNTEMVNSSTETNKSAYVETVGFTISKGDIVYASPRARFEVQGMDQESGLKEVLVSVNGSEYASYRAPISFLKPGTHSLSYKFVDRVGNISSSQSFSVILDNEAPRVLELQLSPAPYEVAGIHYIGPATEFSFKAHDDLAGLAYVEYSTNKGQDMVRFETNTTFASLGYSNTASIYLDYRATDMVSNVSAVKSRVFVMDALAPTVDVFSKAVEIDGVRYISSRDTISIEAYDDTAVSNIMYSINGSEYQEYDPQIGINFNESGEFTVTAKATDVVGNVSTEVEYKVTVDFVAPTGEASYIGEVRSIEYDPLATTEQTQETPAQNTVPAVKIEESEVATTDTEEVVAE